MHAERHHHSHHGCHEPRGYSQSRGLEMFYGYCHDSGTMRMMDYPDYLSNAQTAYSNLYSGAASTAQPYIDMMMGRTPATGRQGDRGRDGIGIATTRIVAAAATMKIAVATIVIATAASAVPTSSSTPAAAKCGASRSHSKTKRGASAK